MRGVPVIAVTAACLPGAVATAATLTWHFDSGLSGWTVSGNTSARWVDPAVEPDGPLLPDGTVSHAGAGNLYLPDGGYAELDVSPLNLGGSALHNGFIFEADLYLPNLRPLTGFANDCPGNMDHNAGLLVGRSSDRKGPWLAGNVSRAGESCGDKSWYGSTLNKSWIKQEMTGPSDLWWDRWITARIDYGYSVPGKWTSSVHIPWVTPVGGASGGNTGWYTVASNLECHPTDQFSILRLGSMPFAASWTQCQFDNARLTWLPEPATLGLLVPGAGLRLRRRR